MRGTLTFNENTSAGRMLFQILTTMPEFKFKAEDGGTRKETDKGTTAADRKKKRLLAKMSKARNEAEEIMKSGAKGHTIAEILETI